MNQIQFAKDFTAKKFEEVNIKNHYLDVLNILKNDFHIKDEPLLVAAILHDTLEDTNTTYEELEHTFSKEVADLVQEVSHPKNYNEVQKVEYYKHLAFISLRAKMIKFADFTSHLRTFIEKRKLSPTDPYHDQYIVRIRTFLESCPESEVKKTVYDLTSELSKYVTYHFDK
jgi:(p)ppGpp synthase/HD superfamily hydrolase